MTEAEKVKAAAASIAKVRDFKPQIVVVCGTGLASLGEHVDNPTPIDYKDIDEFPYSTVIGHPGQLLLGEMAGKNVAMLHGRFHLYEGWSPQEATRPLRALAKLGADTLIVTNCAGSLNVEFQTPCAMLIEDQINLSGRDPLTGPDDPELGERFVDMTNCYDLEFRKIATEVAKELDINLFKGIYAGLHGPMFETQAERRMLGMLGADAVGMSTVLEVIVARQEKMRVLGYSALANMATGGEEQKPDSHEEIIAATLAVAKDLSKMITKIIAKLP